MKDKIPTGRQAFRILNNTAAFVGGEFFYHFVNFLAGILIARSLGTEAYGAFSFIFVYLSFFEIFVQFGINSILTRELAQDKEHAPHILGNALMLRAVMAAMGVMLALIMIKILHYPVSIQQGVFLASFQLFLTLRAIYETIFRVNLQMIYPSLWNGVKALVNLLAIFFIVSYHPTISWLILSYLGSGLVGLVGIALFANRFVRITFRWDWPLIKRLLKESAPLITSGYLTLLYYRVDIMMLSKMKGFSDVGYYTAATRLTEALDVVAAALMTSLFPILARAFKGDRREFERLIAKAFFILLIVGLPIALGGSFVAKDLMVSLFGEIYSRSALTLGILFWYTFFGFFSTLLVNLLIICGRQIVDVWISFTLILLNIGMNFFLIPAFSYNGAAAATVLTEIFGITFMLIYATKQPSILLPLPVRELRIAAKINLLFIGILGVLKIFLPMPVYGFILLSVLIYGLLLWAAGIVKWGECKSYIRWFFNRSKVPA